MEAERKLEEMATKLFPNGKVTEVNVDAWPPYVEVQLGPGFWVRLYDYGNGEVIVEFGEAERPADEFDPLRPAAVFAAENLFWQD